VYGRDSRAPPPDRGNFEERLAADGDINRFASDFVWETSADEYITQINLFSNAAHQTQSFRTGFGFSAVTVQVLTPPRQERSRRPGRCGGVKRLLILSVVALTACSNAVVTSTTEPQTATTTEATKAPEFGAGRAEVEAALAAIGPILSLAEANEVVDAVASGSETDLIPYVFDIARVADADTFERAMETISRLTGEMAPADDFRTRSRFFGDWIMDNAPDPGPAYVDWKAELFANIDPDFGPLISSVADAVTATRLQWGGVLRGGIPELNDAETISVGDAGYMLEDEVVFGAVVNGEARAYPVRILGHHELANDTLGGEPVSLVYCTLCRTPVLFHREVGERVLDFETSGLLQNSNKVMVDVQTDSLWNQVTGEAFAGPLAGETLDRLPFVVTTWAEWITQHPETDVQKVPTLGLDPDLARLNPTGGYSYEPGDAYADYYANSELWFPSFEVPDDFAQKDEVVTLDYRGARLAVGLEALVEARAFATTVAGQPVVFLATDAGARVYESVAGVEIDGDSLAVGEGDVEITEDALLLPDGSELARLVSGQSFWFAWYGNYPDTDWWPRN